LIGGTGRLVINYSPNHKHIYNFSDGKLNDTSLQVANGKVKRLFIYKNNILIKQDWSVISRVVVNYDENGFAHDSTFVFGRPPIPLYLILFNFYYDPYNGKLYQVNVYEHGQLKAQIFYKKNGDIKKASTIKYIKKTYLKKTPKNCL
jgi:hypothetical protein